MKVALKRLREAKEAKKTKKVKEQSNSKKEPSLQERRSKKIIICSLIFLKMKLVIG